MKALATVERQQVARKHRPIDSAVARPASPEPIEESCFFCVSRYEPIFMWNVVETNDGKELPYSILAHDGCIAEYLVKMCRNVTMYEDHE